MARKDNILQAFLEHRHFTENEDFKSDELPEKVVDALQSDSPIIKVIGMIIESKESNKGTTAKALYTQITATLNK